MKSGKLILISFFLISLMASCDTTSPKEKVDQVQDAKKIEQSTTDNVEEKVATDTVFISGMKFNPEELHVHKGATVIWINDGIVPHDVTDFPDKTWTSDTIKIGQSWKKTIDKSLDYFCSIHITMKGKIIVDN